MNYLTEYYKNRCEQLQEKINLLKKLIAESEAPTATEFEIPQPNTPPNNLPKQLAPQDDPIRSIIEIIKKYLKNKPKPKPMPEPDRNARGI